MKENIGKSITAMSLLLVMTFGISACTKTNEPDPVITSGHVTNAKDLNANNNVPMAKPNLGAGVTNGSEPKFANEPVDNNLTLVLPNDKETIVSKNERIHVKIYQTKPDTVFKVSIYYSADGNDNSTIDLGEITSKDIVDESVVIPENISSGKYVLALEADGSIYSSNIAVK